MKRWKIRFLQTKGSFDINSHRIVKSLSKSRSALLEDVNKAGYCPSLGEGRLIDELLTKLTAFVVNCQVYVHDTAIIVRDRIKETLFDIVQGAFKM